MAYTIVDALRDMGRGDLKLVSAEVQESRMTICKSCSEYNSLISQCKKCHCLLIGKTKIEKATCPIGKW